MRDPWFYNLANYNGIINYVQVYIYIFRKLSFKSILFNSHTVSHGYLKVSLTTRRCICLF